MIREKALIHRGAISGTLRGAVATWRPRKRLLSEAPGRYRSPYRTAPPNRIGYSRSLYFTSREFQARPRGVDRANFVINQSGGQPGLTHDILSHIARDARSLLRPCYPKPSSAGKFSHLFYAVVEFRAHSDEPDDQIARPVGPFFQLNAFGQFSERLLDIFRGADQRDGRVRLDAEFLGQRRAGITREI